MTTRSDSPRRDLRDTRPRSDCAARGSWSASGGRRAASVAALCTVDHKLIGRRYIVTAFVFLALGGVLAMLMRLQLARPEAGCIGPDRYNQIFTMHGSNMMFLFAVPVMEAIARLSRAADGRHPQHRLPAAECLLLLDVSGRRHPAVDRLRAQHGAGRRLVRLCAAVRARNTAPASAPTSGRR